MSDLHEMAEAAMQDEAAKNREVMDAFDRLDAAFADVFAKLPKPTNPRGE